VVQAMVEIVSFNPDLHWQRWEQFIQASYQDPDYVLLSPMYLRWQFLDNPANTTGKYSLQLVLHAQEVIAQLGEIPFIGVTSDGEKFEGSYPINLMVRPEYRASGLGAILLKQLLKRARHVLNPGSSSAGATLCSGLGMLDLGVLRRYLCIIDPQSARRLTVDGRLPERVPGAARKAGAADVVSLLGLPVQMPDTFTFPLPACGAERSRSFLNWRYERHPSFRYEFLLTCDYQNILVYREEYEGKTQTRVIRIVDFLARGRAQGDLLAAAVDLAERRGVAAIDFYCSTDAYHAALMGANFFAEAEYPNERIAARLQPLDYRKTNIRVLATPIETGADARAPEWFVTKGDSDQDRPNNRWAGGLSQLQQSYRRRQNPTAS
jgi:GNAT superfamily N-acetyltransferase